MSAGRLSPLGSGAWTIDTGTTDSPAFCLLTEAPAGLILFDPPAEHLLPLLAALDSAGWSLSDVLAILTTGSSESRIKGALRLASRHRRCRLIVPAALSSRLTRRWLSTTLSEVEEVKTRELHARIEYVRPSDTVGPGGRSVDVIDILTRGTVGYVDLPSAAAFVGGLLSEAEREGKGRYDDNRLEAAVLRELSARNVRFLVLHDRPTVDLPEVRSRRSSSDFDG